MSKLSGLIKLKTRFVNAESPSPVKLSASFRQVEDALQTIEYTLGNGNDTYISEADLVNRLTLPNLSSAIGKGSNIYKPVNKYKDFQEAVSSITPVQTIENNSISVASGTISISFKAKSHNRYLLINKVQGSTIASSGGEILPVGSENDYWVACLVASGATSLDLTITGGDSTTITELALIDTTDYLNIIFKNSDTVNACNQAICMPLDNIDSLGNYIYWRVRTPCDKATNQETLCAVRSCAYCIGNIYDEYGVPQCGNVVNSVQQYVAAVTDKKVFQSCLLKNKNKPYQILNAPFGFSLNGVTEDEELQPGTVYVYDRLMSTNPVLATTSVYKATNDRADIFYTRGLQEIVETTDRYLLVGGTYGISDQLLDLHSITISKIQELQA